MKWLHNATTDAWEATTDDCRRYHESICAL
jgi:hypothetical protein